jgi:hypothetical protein
LWTGVSCSIQGYQDLYQTFVWRYDSKILLAFQTFITWHYRAIFSTNDLLEQLQHQRKIVSLHPGYCSGLETIYKMQQAVSTKYLTASNIYNFPCEGLRIINQLWLDASGDKFGFSVQTQIF